MPTFPAPRGDELIGTGLPKARNARVDDPRIDLRNRVVVDAQPMFDVCTVVFDHHVRFARKLEKQLPTPCMLEIECDASLVAMQILVVVAESPGACYRVRRAWPLDTDDVCPPIGQLTHRRRTRSRNRQIKDSKIRKRKLRLGKAWACHELGE